jgi:hypothetical protein
VHRRQSGAPVHYQRPPRTWCRPRSVLPGGVSVRYARHGPQRRVYQRLRLRGPLSPRSPPPRDDAAPWRPERWLGGAGAAERLPATPGAGSTCTGPKRFKDCARSCYRAARCTRCFVTRTRARTIPKAGRSKGVLRSSQLPGRPHRWPAVGPSGPRRALVLTCPSAAADRSGQPRQVNHGDICLPARVI